MGCAFVFPGQGSQTVGMCSEIAAAYPVARRTLEEVDDALGRSLSRIIEEGPQEVLTLTENAQPALMAVSMAVLRVLESEAGFDLWRDCRFVAGHSLGEYTALAAARSLRLADTARLLQTRGQAMQRAVPVGDGGMAAVLGAEFDLVVEIAALAEARTGEVCVPANDNAPGQVVLSGAISAIDCALEIAKEKGVRRSIRLPVSAPFHCPLMAPAAEVMKESLAVAEIGKPKVPIIANVTAEPVDGPDEIRKLLVLQVTGLVRWRETVLRMRDDGINTIVELGAGKILSGLVRRIDRGLTAISVETPEDMENARKLIPRG